MKTKAHQANLANLISANAKTAKIFNAKAVRAIVKKAKTNTILNFMRGSL